MNKTWMVLAAAFLAAVAFADDEEESSAEATGEASSEVSEAAETAEASGPAEAALDVPEMKAPPPKPFTALPLCRRIEGVAQVRTPNGEWTMAEEGRFYPFGTSYRTTKGSSLVVAFGTGSTVKIVDDAEFGTRLQSVGEKTRTVVVTRGTMRLKLADNLPEGVFTVAAPGFVLKNLAGESYVTYSDMGDGDMAEIRCVTGSLGVEGRHFDIPFLRAADEMKVRTSRDHLCTFLYGVRGDYVVNVDQGLCTRDEFADDGTIKSVVDKRHLEWHLSPSTKVVINRSVPAIGERMSVHTMAFDAAGEKKSECSFCEGRAEINSGELVVNKDKAASAEAAKRALEAAETTEEAAAEEEPESAEESSSDDEGSSDDDSDDDE